MIAVVVLVAAAILVAVVIVADVVTIVVLVVVMETRAPMLVTVCVVWLRKLGKRLEIVG